MTLEGAMAYAKRRMKELGYKNHYRTRYRYIILKKQEVLKLKVFNQILLVLENPVDVMISSEMGDFNIDIDYSNELILEHSGQVVIENKKNQQNHIKLLHLIPTHKANKK